VLVPAAFVLLETLTFLHLIPAIALIEVILARRILAVSVLRSVVVVVAANIASALVGLPLLYLPQLSGIGHPYRGDGTIVGLMLLCVPCLFLSIWVESRVAARLVPADRRALCRRWSVEANCASYFMIMGVLAILLAAAAAWRRQGLIP
jgi:hypothetical protein